MVLKYWFPEGSSPRQPDEPARLVEMQDTALDVDSAGASDLSIAPIAGEPADDYGDFLDIHAAAMAKLDRSPYLAGRVKHVVRTYVDDIDVSLKAVVTYPTQLSTAFSGAGALAPFPQSTISCDGLLSAEQDAKISCDGVIQADDEDSNVSCDGVIAETDQDQSVSSDGHVSIGMLDIKGTVWVSSDAATLSWSDIESATLSSGNTYIVAVHIRYDGSSSVTGTTITLEVNVNGGGWETMSASTAWNMATPSTYTDKSDGDPVAIAEFVNGWYGAEQVDGVVEYDTTFAGVTMSDVQETEFWYGIQPQAGAVGTSSVFRVVSSTTGILYADTFEVGTIS